MADNKSSDFDEEKEITEANAKAEEEVKASEKEDAGNDEEAESDEEESKESEKSEEADEGDDEDKKNDEDEVIEPPVKKTAKDYIIERKNRKIKKLKAQKSEEKEAEEELGAEEEDDSSFTPEDNSAIDKRIQKHIAPIIDKIVGTAEENEFKAVLTAHPDAKKMEKSIKEWAKHPAYKDVPLEIIYFALAGKRAELQAKKTEAKREDKKNVTGGHTRRTEPGKVPDFSKMSDEEFKKYDDQVTYGQ